MEREREREMGSTSAKAWEGRLRKQAPALLQIEPRKVISPAALGSGLESRSPIPLLSPLVLPPPVPPGSKERATDSEGGANGDYGGPPPANAEAMAGGWRHPALAMLPVDPASLLPKFQSQCSIAHNARSSPLSGQVFLL